MASAEQESGRGSAKERKSKSEKPPLRKCRSESVVYVHGNACVCAAQSLCVGRKCRRVVRLSGKSN